MFTINYSIKFLIDGEDCQTEFLASPDVVKSFKKDGFPDISHPLQFRLNKKAELTDCLSQESLTTEGLLINKNLKNVLASFSLISHKYYPVDLILNNKDVSKEYSWLHVYEDLSAEIDFERSEFYEMYLAERRDEIKFTSFEDYLNQSSLHDWKWRAAPKMLYIKQSSKLRQLDLFKFNVFDYAICISEKLKNELEKQGITGIDIKDYKKINF